MIVFAFIRAERTSNFELHLQAARSMLPYFVSAGHHQYAKVTRLYLQLFDTWKELYPDLVKKFFDEGFIQSGMHQEIGVEPGAIWLSRNR